MPYEVVVVGGGIGGLTTAALLAARGVSVCLLERQSTPGGCVAPFEKFGYSFESGAALYPLWGKEEIHQRIFSELPVPAPEVRKIDPVCCVRLAGRGDVTVSENTDAFFLSLRANFPECADLAVAFYAEAEARGNLLLTAIDQDLWASLPAQLAALAKDTTIQHLNGLSPRFRRFLDAQLQVFAQSMVDECSYLYSCLLAALRTRGFFSIRGGAIALAETLAQAIKKSGGTIRLNSHVLRLAYDVNGGIAGVQLLTGEVLTASRAVISNLTVWDTYGKLVGMDRTPKEIRQRLKDLNSSGVYQLLFGVGETQAQNLPAEHIIAVTDPPAVQGDDSPGGQLTFTMAPSWDPRAPQGMRAATVHLPADVTEWFTYHVDETEHEQQDQETLETVWSQLHSVLPELGDSIELIETVTPRDWYETTRRKLGMVGGLPQTPSVFGPNGFTQETLFPNLFLVGDTVFPGAGVAAVSHGALSLANRLTGRRPRQSGP